MFNIKKEIIAAYKRIRPHIRTTPLDFSLALSKNTQMRVYLKCENLQYTGAFKVRGAFNKLLSLTEAERKRGVVTASSGNHGAAVAFGLNKLKIPGLVFVPENASSVKVENIHNYKVPLEHYATDCMQTELHALQYAKEHNMVYVSPYNDLQVIAGQGTIALELLQQLAAIDVIFVPIGGGGLISGIAAYIKAMSPQTKIIGCLPENSPVMAASIKAGKIIEIPTLPTLSDATAGGIEPNAITFDFCQKFVDDYTLVSEDEIKNALCVLMQTQHLLAEGAAGVALAALLKTRDQHRDKNVVAVLSGANISLDSLKIVLG
jgi:threonine dehydratase